MNKYDSDSDDEEAKTPSPSTTNTGVGYDPERNERIRQMVAASNGSSVLEDEQITNFVLRMAEKNQKMIDNAQQQQQPRRSQPPPRRQQPSQRQVRRNSDDDEYGDDELDASFGQNNTQTRRSKRHATPDDYPPGEGYAGRDGEVGAFEIPSYDPKDDDYVSCNHLFCIICSLIFGMILASVLIIFFVVIADEGTTNTYHHSSGTDGIVLPVAPSNLKDLCALDNLQDFQAVLDCREPCMRAACCWEKREMSKAEPACWESHPLECAPYESCVNLLQANGSPPSYGVQASTTSGSVPKATEGINACKADSISSVDQVLMCENACRLGECCWKSSAASSKCSTDPNCADYQVCTILDQGNGSPAGGSGASVEAAPGNLADLCSQESLDACQYACNKASCCWQVATHTYMGPFGATITESVYGSCAKESLDVCKGYEPCRYLPKLPNQDANFQTVSIPPAPSTLEDTCAASLQGDCKDACDKATCCWQLQTHSYTGPLGDIVNETVVGACSHRDDCVGYTPCKALVFATAAESGTTVPPTAAPASVPATQQTNLEAVCAQSLDGACRDTCNQAECCWKMATSTYLGPHGEPVTESVFGVCSHLAECETYSACRQLPEATASHVHDNITAAPANLNETCNVASGYFDGPCRDTCNLATCCWKLATTTMTGPHGASMTESVMGSCSREQPTICSGYAVCKKLPEATEVPPKITSTSSLTIPAPPAELEETCNGASGSVDKLGLCDQYCSVAICCWKMSTHTYTNSNGEIVTESQQGACAQQPGCDAYKPCSILDPDVYSPHVPSIDLAPSPNPTSLPPFSSTTEYTEEVIYDVCYNHAGKTLCEKVCDPGACCFKPDNPCPTDSTIECSKYEPCQILLQSDGNGVLTAVEAACSDLTDLAACVEQCAKGTCCFTTDIGKTCDITAPGTKCSQFTACEVLYKGSSNP